MNSPTEDVWPDEIDTTATGHGRTWEEGHNTNEEDNHSTNSGTAINNNNNNNELPIESDTGETPQTTRQTIDKQLFTPWVAQSHRQIKQK
jgi:hypothetical protein